MNGDLAGHLARLKEEDSTFAPIVEVEHENDQQENSGLNESSAGRALEDNK